MIEFIKTVPLLAKLPETELAQLIEARQIYLKDYAKGATVYGAKDTCKTMDIVASGGFIAYSLTENGSAMTVFEFTQGRTLGANLLFGDNHSYPFSIYCSENGRLLHIEKGAVQQFIRHYDFALGFIGAISQNAQGLNRRMTMTTQRTLRENLLDYLKQQSILQGSDIITLPISKKQLADYLGVQRPSLFRELKKLSDEGVIDGKNKIIRLNSCVFSQ